MHFSHSQDDSMVVHVHIKIIILYHWTLDCLEINSIINIHVYIHIYVAFKTQELMMCSIGPGFSLRVQDGGQNDCESNHRLSGCLKCSKSSMILKSIQKLISFASESLMDPRIQVKLEYLRKYNFTNIIVLDLMQIQTVDKYKYSSEPIDAIRKPLALHQATNCATESSPCSDIDDDRSTRNWFFFNEWHVRK